jgi:N-dimethylarginine dimethylaminohydrolase
MARINQKVLMSGVDYFSDEFAINSLMDSSVVIDIEKAKQEHQSIKNALEQAEIEVIQVMPPKNCQDGVYTANWALTRGNKALLSSLPNKRKGEEEYAERTLKDMGYETFRPPCHFSGQGDALPCGNIVFAGQGYRTESEAHRYITQFLGYEVVALQTIPELNTNNQPIINVVTGWPDSFFYDIDLALAVLSPNLIAWCPEAFTPDSQAKIRALTIEKIVVSYKEAVEGFACNLVSNAETVVMSNKAPGLQAALESKGFTTITPEITELAKGGGYIRCTTLTL